MFGYSQNMEHQTGADIFTQLQRSENLLRNAQRFAKLGSWEFDLHTHELVWSEELYRIYEIDPDETPSDLLYEEYLRRFAEEDKPELFRCIEEAINQAKRYHITHRIFLPDGKVKWILGSGVPVQDEHGKVVKLIGYGQDITDRKNTEIELDQFFRLSNEMLCLADFNGQFLKVSVGWKAALGYELEELTSTKFLDFVHPEDLEKTVAEMGKLSEGEYTMGFENRYRHKNGAYRIISWNAAPHKSTGLIYCVARDVTNERESEQKLKTALHDKELLLKEVHHRVKNNLQIISSLLSLQSNYEDDTRLRGLLTESQSRVKSMAGVHELLYQSGDLITVDFEKYLARLANDLSLSYFGENCQVNIEILARVSFNIDTAIPLGLLLNEILSNAFKYGTKNRPDDLVYVSITPLNDHKFRLIAGDNGSGFDFSSIAESSQTMGVMLIQELSQQLNGALTYLKKPGTWYQLDFEGI
jgi:PAS domain S-box-containing protein